MERVDVDDDQVAGRDFDQRRASSHSTPIAVIGVGAAIATAIEGGAQLPIGILVGVVSLALLWPWFYVREVVIDDESVIVTAGLPGKKKVVRHPRASLELVRWRMKRPKPTTSGSSHARAFHLELVGPGELAVAIPIERYDVSVARDLGAKLGLPVERVVDGEVAERWDAQGETIL